MKCFLPSAKQPGILLFLLVTPQITKIWGEGNQQWNTRPFVILFPSCDWSVNSMRSFTLLAIGSPRWIELALCGGKLCRWSQIVVCISSLTQSPPITYTWPLRSKRHTLDKRESKAQLDTWLEVRTPWCFIILLLFSLKFFYYCLSIKITFYQDCFSTWWHISGWLLKL